MNANAHYEAAVTQACTFTQKFNQYSVVSRADSRLLLGEDVLAKLDRDPILRPAPRGWDGFYYWNVAAAIMKYEEKTMTTRIKRTARAMFPDDEKKWPGAEIILQGLVDSETAELRKEIEALEARLAALSPSPEQPNDE